MKTASALLKSEARLLARNPGVVIWTVVLPVTASIVLAAIPAIRRPDDSLGGLSFFQVYQPVLVLFAITLLAVQALPDVLTRYREMGVLKRLRDHSGLARAAAVRPAALTMIVSVAACADGHRARPGRGVLAGQHRRLPLATYWPRGRCSASAW